jgi:hypothetical protein
VKTFIRSAEGKPCLPNVIARSEATKQSNSAPIKYFVASRLATPVSFCPCSFRNRRTRLGSRFNNSRSRAGAQRFLDNFLLKITTASRMHCAMNEVFDNLHAWNETAEGVCQDPPAYIT